MKLIASCYSHVVHGKRYCNPYILKYAEFEYDLCYLMNKVSSISEFYKSDRLKSHSGILRYLYFEWGIYDINIFVKQCDDIFDMLCDYYEKRRVDERCVLLSIMRYVCQHKKKRLMNNMIREYGQQIRDACRDCICRRQLDRGGLIFGSKKCVHNLQDVCIYDDNAYSIMMEYFPPDEYYASSNASRIGEYDRVELFQMLSDRSRKIAFEYNLRSKNMTILQMFESQNAETYLYKLIDDGTIISEVKRFITIFPNVDPFRNIHPLVHTCDESLPSYYELFYKSCMSCALLKGSNDIIRMFLESDIWKNDQHIRNGVMRYASCIRSSYCKMLEDAGASRCYQFSFGDYVMGSSYSSPYFKSVNTTPDDYIFDMATSDDVWLSRK